MPPKKKKEKKVNWRGRIWTIRFTTDPILMSSKYGEIINDQSLIVVRDDISDDLKIMTVLHELGHEMFPEWSDEPSDKSASEVGVFERDLKTILEELGVDLSPLIQV